MSEDSPSQRKFKQQKKKPRPPKKITQSYLHNSGLYYLERFAASSAHFRTVMMRKVRKSCAHHKDQNFEECSALVDQLVEKFIGNGLLNDEAYVNGNVTSMRRRGLSTRSIVAKLQAKGVSPDQTRTALEAYHDDHEIDPQKAELLGALIYAKKKRMGCFGPEIIEHSDKEKQMARLARQGFSYDICQRVFEMDEETAEDFIYENRL